MSELPKPPAEKEGGQGWSVLDGEVLPDPGLLTNLQLDEGDVARFMGEVAKQRFLAVEATTAAYELSHPILQKAAGVSVALQRQAAQASMPDSDLPVDSLRKISLDIENSGLGKPPIVETLEQMLALGNIDEDIYWRARLIVGRLYTIELSQKSV